MLALLLGCLAAPSPASADVAERDANGARVEAYGFYASRGQALRIWARKRYSGYEPTCAGAFIERVIGEPVILAMPSQVRLRVEFRHERLAGTIALFEDQVAPAKRDGGEPYLKELDGNWNLAGLFVPRLVLFPSWPVRPTLHAGFGLSWLNRRVLDEGTHYNYNLLAGLGMEADMTARWMLFADCRWEHYSNGGRMYLTNRAVIGIESVNAVVGIRRSL